MNPLIPQLKLGMLSFQHGGATLGMGPVFEVDLIVVGEYVVNLQPLGPWVYQAFLRPLEIILNVALPAHIGAHFLARRHRVDVVILHPLGRLERPYTFEKSWPRHAKLHRFSIMA